MMEKEEKDILEGLNPAQEAAVRNTEGPTLIIAGAGSGKTRVLTCRIAWLLAHGVKPWEILALTFTNKAATEMKTRISDYVGEEKARRIWMGTFHSVFVRFLRKYADLLGYPQSFTIYDQTDSRSVIKECIRELDLGEKVYKPAAVQNRISLLKNNLYTAATYKNSFEEIAKDQASLRGKICDIYSLYAKKCKASGAMDFDDLLLKTSILLKKYPDACNEVSSRFRFILVDEYQDTNYAQYSIIKRLSVNHHNLCVVGDDSQSIYRFRGALIENILQFQKDYPDAKLFRLEQNYRSTQNIVNAANSLIEHNAKRIHKECFSRAEIGEKIHLLKGFNEMKEADLVASSIVDRINMDKASYSSFAILYRTNDQSRPLEQSLRWKNLPYRTYGSHPFFERMEVKDMIAYFRLAVNPKDDASFHRVINTPSRGIGTTSMERLTRLATLKQCSLYEAASSENEMEQVGIKDATASKFHSFANMIASFSKDLFTTDAFTLAKRIEITVGYTRSIRGDERMTMDEINERLRNIEELFNGIKVFVDTALEKEPENNNENNYQGEDSTSLRKYLEDIALMTDKEKDDSLETTGNKITLMSIHAAKGTEFPYVYITGMEDELFPAPSLMKSEADLEEERRLFYVALTRAEKVVTLSFARSRLQWGEAKPHTVSRFVREIDRRYLDGTPDSEESPFFWQRPYGGNRNPAQTVSRPVQTVLRPTPQPTVHAAFSRPTRTPSANFQADAIADLRPGQRVEHDRFGFGEILRFEDNGPQMKAIVRFDDSGEKTLLLKFAKLRIVHS